MPQLPPNLPIEITPEIPTQQNNPSPGLGEGQGGVLKNRKLLIILSIPASLILLALLLAGGKQLLTSLRPTPTPVPTLVPTLVPTPTPIPFWKGYESKAYGLFFSFPPQYIATQPPPAYDFVKHTVSIPGDGQFSLQVDVYSRPTDKDGKPESLQKFTQSFHDYYLGGRTPFPTPISAGEYGAISFMSIDNLPTYTFSSLKCPPKNKVCQQFFTATGLYFYHFSLQYSRTLPYQIAQFLTSITITSQTEAKCTPSKDICDPAGCDYTPDKCQSITFCKQNGDCQLFPCNCSTALSRDFLKNYTGTNCNLNCQEFKPVCINNTCQSVRPTSRP